MDVTISIASLARVTALDRALSVYNVSNPPLTHQAFLQKIAEAQIDNLVTAYVVVEWDPVQWQRERFTSEERALIRQAGMTNGFVADLLALLDQTRAKIRMDDPLVIAGLNKLVEANLLQGHRPAEILAI